MKTKEEILKPYEEKLMRHTIVVSQENALKALSEQRVETLKEIRSKIIKTFEEVKIGDKAYENPFAGGQWANLEGMVIWKGDHNSLMHSAHKFLWDDDEETPEEVLDYNWVVVSMEDEIPHFETLTLFNYDCDPCGVVCYKI